MFFGAEQLRPDILISPPTTAPIAIETEFAPATTVENDAQLRLGQIVAKTGRKIEQVAAVRIPANLKSVPQYNLHSKIDVTQFEWAFFQLTENTPGRMPKSGWLKGDLNDFARCVESAASSEQLIAKATIALETAVSVCAERIKNETETTNKIGTILYQEAGEQTNRMGIAIVANAFNFHTAIAGNHGIPTLAELRKNNAVISIYDILDEWNRIINDVNYWPVFKLASDILKCIPAMWLQQIIQILTKMTDQLINVGVTSMHDISGRMLQKLIADRKFLATFYTLPSSAAFLAELAIPQMNFGWSDKQKYSELKIADFSCGTGTLISAAYSSVLSRYRRSGGNDKNIHTTMMENSMIATDIMPVATHLTTSQLSSAHPTTTFQKCKVYTMPYGYTETHGTTIGSLDLIIQEGLQSLFPETTIKPIQTVDSGQPNQLDFPNSAAQHTNHEPDSANDIEILGSSLDLVIMNPPFTRPTNHETAEVPVPSFAGFETPAEEQKRMSKRLTNIRGQLSRIPNAVAGTSEHDLPNHHMDGTRLPAGNGNAGLASNFIDLAHAKVKPGGVIAFVLPFTFVNGGAWAGARQLIADYYENTMIVSVAHYGNKTRAFSADTGMAEILLISTRRRDKKPTRSISYVNLFRRPANILEAVELARIARGVSRANESVSRFEFGDQHIGNHIRASLSNGGCAGLVNSEIAEAMIALKRGLITMRTLLGSVSVPVTKLSNPNLGIRGPVHRDIGNRRNIDNSRSIFRIVDYSTGASYPALWNHDASNERCIEVMPDAQGIPRPERQTRFDSLGVTSFQNGTLDTFDLGENAKSSTIYLEEAKQVYLETATRLHFNLDFRLNSQSLAACVTPERSLGGTAWPSYIINSKDRNFILLYERVISLWTNTTFGLMTFWWLGTRQQQGRSRLTITELPELTVLDPLSLKQVELEKASEIFQLFRGRQFLPANEAYRCDTRKDLDRAVIVDLLRLPEAVMEALTKLRYQWCCEPSVHGGKSTRPDEA